MLSREAQLRLLEATGIVPATKEDYAYTCEGGPEWCSAEKGLPIALNKRMVVRDPFTGYPSNTTFRCHKCDYANPDTVGERDSRSLALQRYPVAIHDVHYILSYELEKLVLRDGGSVIGYIDLLYQVRMDLLVDLLGPDGDVWVKDYANHTEVAYVIVECKPAITTFQGVMRQIKTYRHYYPRRSYCAIVTYTALPDDALNVFQNEDIHVLRCSPPSDDCAPEEHHENT